MSDDVATRTEFWLNSLKVPHYLALSDLGELLKDALSSSSTCDIRGIDTMIQWGLQVEEDLAQALPELLVRLQSCEPLLNEMLYHIHYITTGEEMPIREEWWRPLLRLDSDQRRRCLAKWAAGCSRPDTELPSTEQVEDVQQITIDEWTSFFKVSDLLANNARLQAGGQLERAERLFRETVEPILSDPAANVRSTAE